MQVALHNVGLPEKVKRIIFVCHSMGGLVTRAYLTDFRDEVRDKVGFIYFFATPSSGSDLATLGRTFLRNTQLANMSPIEGDAFLRDLQARWLSAGYGRSIASYCAYETKPTPLGIVVPWPSAFGLCNEGVIAVEADHMEIVKPANIDAKSHVAFRTAYQASLLQSHAPALKLVPASALRLLYERATDQFVFVFNGVVKSSAGAADAVTDVYARVYVGNGNEPVPFGANDVSCTRSGQAVGIPFLFAAAELSCTFRKSLGELSRRTLMATGEYRISISLETDDKRGYSAQYCMTLDRDDVADLFGRVGQFSPYYSLCRG
jgi:pimeloyl-ACP methyl ester carboxylesterase